MKECLIIFNVGTSDIDHSLINKSKDNYYLKTKEIYEKNIMLENCVLPIIDPVINYINNFNYRINKVFLFGTEQVSGNRESYSTDTYYAAEIIRKILIDKNIEAFTIKISYNPSDLDKMYDFYKKFFEDFGFSENFDIFISLTGGTPAQNMSLLINSVSYFGKKVQCLYLPRGSSDVKNLEIATHIYKKFLKNQIDLLVENHLYESAAYIIEEYGLDYNLDYIKAENYRILFDFKNALIFYEKALKKTRASERNYINEKIDRIKKIINLEKIKKISSDKIEAYLLLLNELYENIEIKKKQGAYADFVGRIFRFEESILRALFEIKFDVSTDDKEEFSKFINESEEGKEIKMFLQSKNIDPSIPNRRVLKGIIEYLVENKNDKKISQFYSKIEKIEKLSDLRNKSILAHGFEGLSKEAILTNLSPHNPTDECLDRLMNDLKEILNLMKQFIPTKVDVI